MPPKRDQTLAFRLAPEEMEVYRRLAYDWDMDISELARISSAVGLSVLDKIPFARRIHLEDNTMFRQRQ